MVIIVGKWGRWYEFESKTELFAFQIELISLGKVLDLIILAPAMRKYYGCLGSLTLARQPV